MGQPIALHISVIVTVLLGTVLWVVAMCVLRRANFNGKDGRKRRFDARAERGSVRSSEIEYHNKAIYADFEFFFKVTLAILGGTAFVVASGNDLQSIDAAAFLIRTGAWLQLLAGLVFSLFVVFHQKSKIERWEEPFGFWQPFAWQEYWMILAMLLISSAYFFSLAPKLVKLFYAS